MRSGRRSRACTCGRRHGTWTATLQGARVASGGEDTLLNVHQGPAATDEPTARLTQVLAGRTLTVDGSDSAAPGGEIVAYLWEFGDGASSGGAVASHTYSRPGTYRVSLAVQDDRGRWGVVTAPTVLEVG